MKNQKEVGRLGDLEKLLEYSPLYSGLLPFIDNNDLKIISYENKKLNIAFLISKIKENNDMNKDIEITLEGIIKFPTHLRPMHAWIDKIGLNESSLLKKIIRKLLNKKYDSQIWFESDYLLDFYIPELKVKINNPNLTNLTNKIYKSIKNNLPYLL